MLKTRNRKTKGSSDVAAASSHASTPTAGPTPTVLSPASVASPTIALPALAVEAACSPVFVAAAPEPAPAAAVAESSIPDAVHEALLMSAHTQLHITLAELVLEEQRVERLLSKIIVLHRAVEVAAEEHEADVVAWNQRLLAERTEHSQQLARVREELTSEAAGAASRANEATRVSRLEADDLRSRLLTAESELSGARSDLQAARAELTTERAATKMEIALTAEAERLRTAAEAAAAQSNAELAKAQNESYELASRLLDEEGRRRKAERRAETIELEAKQQLDAVVESQDTHRQVCARATRLVPRALCHAPCAMCMCMCTCRETLSSRAETPIGRWRRLCWRSSSTSSHSPPWSPVRHAPQAGSCGGRGTPLGCVSRPLTHPPKANAVPSTHPPRPASGPADSAGGPSAGPPPPLPPPSRGPARRERSRGTCRRGARPRDAAARAYGPPDSHLDPRQAARAGLLPARPTDGHRRGGR